MVMVTMGMEIEPIVMWECNSKNEVTQNIKVSN